MKETEKDTLAVIIPVYNEEEIISVVIDDWINSLNNLNINYKIFLYNDGSTDRTQQVLEQASSQSERVEVFLKENSGHGPTVLFGYKQNISDFNWLFQVDSDNEMSPKYFEKLWIERENYDFLIGYREGRESNIFRRALTLFSRIVILLLFGLKVKDVNSPYRLFRSSFFIDGIKKIPNNTFAPNIILSGIASANKSRLYTINVPYTFRVTGTVSLKQMKLFNIGIKCFLQTLSYKLKQK